MTKKSDIYALLPNGLQDLLPPEAEKEARAVNAMMDVFSSFGYRRVKPPLVEFEDSLFAKGPGQSLDHNTFRLMDPVSHRMMGVRSDVTVQISRIASSRLREKERPLRLSYAGDVLRVNGTQLRPERQFCQVGCEFIGTCEHKDTVELCLMALKALDAIDIEYVSIDLSIPTLINTVLKGLDLEKRQAVEACLEKREYKPLEAMSDSSADFLVKLMKCVGPAEGALEKLSQVSFNDETKKDIQDLVSVYQDLKEALEVYGLGSINITIDPLERKGFEYQSGVSFTLFSKNARGELGRGGQYIVEFGDDEKEQAIGFTLYMDTIRRVLQMPELSQTISVSQDESWRSVSKLQSEGWSVVRGAQEFCSHIYKDQKAVPLEENHKKRKTG